VGPELKLVSGTVYVGSHPGEEQRILWIKLDDRIVPTVYTLWRHPGLVPLLHTPEIVVEKMRGGADLNTPGLARGPPFPARAVKGATVAIASYEKPSVPRIVGVCEIDVSALEDVRGKKGHAVRGLHWDGDEIWSWSQNNSENRHAPDHLDGWFGGDKKGDGKANDIPDIDKLRIEDEHGDPDEGGVSLVGAQVQVSSHSEPSHTDGQDPAVPAKEWTTKEVDAAFRAAFLFALHHARATNKDSAGHGIDFPVPQSQLVSNLILPYLPIFTPEDKEALQIKKTSWKNVKKLIKAFEKNMLLRSKDRNGGETVVLDVDFNDPSIVNFTPYRLPKKEAASADSSSHGAGTAPATSDSSIGQTLKRLSLLKPKEKLAPIFNPPSSSRSLYTTFELRPIIVSYLEREDLINATNKRLVKINPILANAVFDTNTSLDREVLAKGSVPRDALIDRIITSCCTPHWTILRNGETLGNCAQKPHAGQPPTVKIQLETRTGNKRATKVSGLEAFFVHAQNLADELQKSCASSTSVGQLMGSSPKNPVMEVMVQGPQKDMVLKALERRGVKKEWVEVVDKTKKK